MNNPLVSIIVPCYNQAQYLDECLQSVLEQTFVNWECIIVNDGSSDRTEEVAQKWCDKDNRFKYVFKVNGGVSGARNLGLNLAKGDFVQFLDQDDCLDLVKLSLSINAIDDFSNNSVVVTNFKMIKENSQDDLKPYCNLTSDLLVLDKILYDWDYIFTIPIHCGFFSARLFDNFRFPEMLKSREDWVMWIEVFKKEPIILFVDKPLAYYRINNQGVTNNRELMQKTLIEALSYISTIVPKDVFNKLILNKLMMALEESNKFEKKYRKVKDSNSFKLGLKIKSIVERFDLLLFARKLLKFLIN